MSGVPVIALLAPTLGRILGSWTVDPPVIAVLSVAAALYCAGVARRRTAWPRWRIASFLAGLFVLALALDSGLDAYADGLLSIHMIQHMLLALVAPPLILCGAPVRVALGGLARAERHALARVLELRAVAVLTWPPVGLALFAAAVLGTHLTGVYELALRDATVHAFEHAAYFWAGILLFAPLIGSDPLPHRPGAIARFSWLMGAMAVMAIPGAVLTFSTHVLYPSYLAPARVLHRSALLDQQLAGAIMWVGGGVVMFAIALTVAMRAMVAEEQRQRRRERYAVPAGEHQVPSAREVARA